MSLKKKYDSSEGILHATIKALVSVRLSELHRDYCVEQHFPGIGVIDILDLSNGLVYEPQKNMSQKVILDKTRKYTSITGIKDVIIIPLKKFNTNMSIKEIYNKIKEVVI